MIIDMNFEKDGVNVQASSPFYVQVFQFQFIYCLNYRYFMQLNISEILLIIYVINNK